MRLRRSSRLPMNRFCALALAVLTMLVGSTASGQSPAALVGRWRTVETSKGGLGSMMTFQAGAVVEYSPGAIVDMPYRVEGNDVILPPATTTGPEQRVPMIWNGTDRLRLGPTGQTGMDLTRQKSALDDSIVPLVGEWAGVQDMGGQKVQVSYLFYPAGRSLLLIRFLTQRGTYSIANGGVRISLPNQPAIDASFTVDGDLLTLTSGGRRTEYRRY
jgi:hypothetical protein